MQTFVSTLSNQAFPIYEKVKGEAVSPSLMAFIRQANPDFNEDSTIALQELNNYRWRFVEASLERDFMELNEPGKLPEIDRIVALQVARESKTGRLSYGQKLADKIAAFGGSWSFILTFMSFIVIWMMINIYAFANKGFDPYPFILLNLILSCVAALQAPVIMMSQNRQEEKDRERTKNDYMVDLKSELQLRMLHEKIDDLMIRQQEALFDIQQAQVDMMAEILKKIPKAS